MTLRGEAGEIVNDPRALEPAVGLRSPEPERRLSRVLQAIALSNCYVPWLHSTPSHLNVNPGSRRHALGRPFIEQTKKPRPATFCAF